jgi:hypothetical protein
MLLMILVAGVLGTIIIVLIALRITVADLLADPGPGFQTIIVGPAPDAPPLAEALEDREAP